MAVDFANIGPTCQKIEDMIAYARPMIGRWPVFYRYTLGEDIYRQMILLLRLATKARLRHYNKTTLQELDTIQRAGRTKTKIKPPQRRKRHGHGNQKARAAYERAFCRLS